MCRLTGFFVGCTCQFEDFAVHQTILVCLLGRYAVPRQKTGLLKKALKEIVPCHVRDKGFMLEKGSVMVCWCSVEFG